MSETAPGPPVGSDELASGHEVIHLRLPEHFEAFYLRELPSLVALARALAGSQGTAEDLAQEAMIAAFRRWDEVARLDIPAAWVRRVCANLATSHLRRRGVETRALLRLGGRRQQHTELAPADDAFWAAVRKLPRRQAQVIALHYVYDMYVSDIALTLECSESTVKVHLVRGRSALAKRLGLAEGDQS
ncbi:MAG TPA: sigma-70 family RNA polymerase sigma factor [Dermatophilaceae bacterium]|nr:sigma-70 family RNA polymerase sigma factor [Dermatophilaceae bacterium]